MEFIRKNVNKPSGTSSTGGGSSGGYSNISSAGNVLETHTIFGQPFDGTNDVRGDLSDVDNITANGDISADGRLVIKGTDEDGAYNDEDFEIAKDDEATRFSGGEEYYFDGDVNAPTFKGNVKANLVEAASAVLDSLVAEEGKIDSLETDDLDAARAYIKDLLSDNITVENLTVTKQAHFFELIIDKIKAAGGAVLLTPADGFKVDRVTDVNGGYRLYWKASDGSRSIANMWKVNDQAICQTFNAATGTSYNVSNKYYWCLVFGTGTVSIDGEDYHYIDISSEIKDGTVNPEEGDEVAMLGYRGTDDAFRQSAIYIAAYNSIDTTLKAPLLAHYKGINDFNLQAHKYTWFAANGNQIQGNIILNSGQSVDEEINAINVVSTQDYWLKTSLRDGISTETIGWQTTPPELDEIRRYLWHYVETTYSDGHTTNSTPSIVGNFAKDGENAIQVKVFSVNGNLTLIGDREVDLYAEVWNGSENITERIPMAAFSWERTSDNPDADASWNLTKVGVGNTIHLADEDVIRRCNFDCIVSIEIIKQYI